jgi:hypothetical protein
MEQTYAPLVSDHDRRLDRMERLMAGQLAARDLEAERQQQAEDLQLAEQAMQIAGRRLDQTFEAGWFEKNKAEIAREMAARPGLLPDAALGESAAEIADAIELASRKLYGEALAERQREQDSRNQADLAEMKSALDRTHSIRVLKRELHGGR